MTDSTITDEPPRRTPPDSFAEIRPSGTTGRRVVLFVLGVAVVVAIIGGSVLVWAMRQIDPGDPGEQVSSIVIPSGSRVAEIAALLEQEGVVTSASVFEWYAKWENKGSGWKAGEYTTFRKNSDMSAVFDVLDKGPVPPDTTSLTIIPGTRLADQLKRIDEAFPDISVTQLELILASGRIKAKYRDPTQPSWEGMLAADTFRFEMDATPEEILQTLADHQSDMMDELGYERAEALTGHSAWDLVKVASLAERETGQPADERGKIARVIFNRLERGEPLGIDASILYGLGRTSGSLTKSDLAKDTPYNNRMHAGLPPTPIATPTRAALDAAINPPAGPWIYYVLVENDPPSHLFTASAREFQAAKEDAKARGVF